MARHEARNALACHLANPFLVLELPPGAQRDEVERQGAKLLSMLAAGLGAARTYPTPWGPQRRSAERVRQALADLRDPDARLCHEWWLRRPAGAPRA